MNRITGMTRRCVDDYMMIEAGDRIAVGLSGGKDSIALLAALHSLKRYYPNKFELSAITIDMGFEGMDFRPVIDFCRELGVAYKIVTTDIAKVVFDDRKEKNPCSLCAKMRRGALNNAIMREGISKLALGHHYDDAVDTFFLSLLYEGRINCFRPKTFMSRSGVTQIRPLLYVGENVIKNAVERTALPVVKSTCPMDKTSKREDVKELINELSMNYPNLKSKVFGAIQRYPLTGWEPAEYTRRPLPERD